MTAPMTPSVTDPAATAAAAPSPADRQAAARAAWLASHRAGHPLSGAELGARFDRSRSWGKARIHEARTASLPPPADGPSLATASPPASPASPSASSAPTASPTWPDTAITLAVALVAAAASYAHMLDLALAAGEPLWVARAFPITVDGLVLAALRRGHDGRHWLALGLALSVAGNVLATFPDLAAHAGPAVSAVPPIALYGTHRLLHNRQNDPTRLQETTTVGGPLVRTAGEASEPEQSLPLVTSIRL